MIYSFFKTVGHVNAYELGRYKSQDSSTMHTHNTSKLKSNKRIN